ncbi:gamma-secretase subunit APH-1A isoform X2 [Pezoporus flaviventris]|uniref:gamma-secretase subunit APH-1A isoform X2 n=1 Tax=Pezoporus flaviventris TaxID=889875 RepID=UPI002AB08106|nr:gamma-secretase subunit APH-1A isoform X2 [Pezoporus flaviventris]
MAAAVFFGCAAIAFGPALALVLLTVAAEPLRVLVLVAGAFFWLVSLLLASLLWFVLVRLSEGAEPRPQRGLLLVGAAGSVLLQELFRFAYFKVLNLRPLLRHHQRHLLRHQHPGRRHGAGNRWHPWGFPLLLHHLSLHHHGPGSAPHLLGHRLLRRLRAPALLGPGAGGHQSPPHLGADIPEPLVRSQPGPYLHHHPGHGPLGLRHCRGLLPQRPQVPLL